MPNDNPTQAALTTRPEKAMVVDSGIFNNFMDSSRFEHLQRVSKVFANSSLVPAHFQGKEADCFIAVEMAMRLQLHPFNLMQSLYVVHGKPGIEAKMAIALINSSGIFDGPLQFRLEGEGMKRKCTAFAAHAKTRQVCEIAVDMDMAKAEGWIDKSGSKWKTMPDMMLRYRSASFFARLYCPEAIFGMQTREELEEIDVTPESTDRPETGRRPTLRERVVVDAEPARKQAAQTPKTPGADASVAELVDSGNIVIHDEPPTPTGVQAPVKPASATSAPPATENDASEPQRSGAMPFDHILGHAKKAKNRDQADIVRDALNDGGYTPEQVQQVKDILNSKDFNK